jgi:hypothetical protein
MYNVFIACLALIGVWSGACVPSRVNLEIVESRVSGTLSCVDVRIKIE